MWKSYVVLIGYLVCCVLVGLLITLISPKECITRKCALKTRLFLRDMNSNIKPCDNFYKFICGNYNGLRITKDDLEHGSVWKEIQENQIRILASFLSPPSTRSEDRVLRVLKMVFKSCMNTEMIDEEGVQPILNNIQQAGGFPLIEGTRWDHKITNTFWSLSKAEYNLLCAGFTGGHIFQTYVGHLVGLKNHYFVHLKPPEHEAFPNSRSDFFFTYVNKICSLLNNTFSSEMNKEINDTLKFMNQISKITEQSKNCSVPFQHQDLKQFTKEFSFLELDSFLKNMLPYVDLPKNIIVTYNSRQYFVLAKTLIEKTPKRILANYLIIQNIMEVSLLLPTRFREAYEELLKNIGKPQIEKNRKMLCIKAVNNKLSTALSALFLREVLKSYIKPNFLLDIMTSLKSQIQRIVRRLPWMDSATKRRAINKVERIDFVSPVPEDTFNILTNKTAFRIYYEDLCFTGNTSDILSAYLALQRFKSNKNWELLERPVEVFDETVDIFSDKIKFNHERNLISIPLGFLRYPSYDQLWPNYLNYGGFSSKVASELVRAIDSTGSHFDGAGRRKEWWSIETKAGYNKHIFCFINQYNSYLKPLSNITVKDPNCMGDIMVGNAGVKAAFLAYASYEQQRFFRERGLPGLKEYSPKQLFFFDFATFYCDNAKDFYREDMTEEEASIASNEYKVLGSLRNLKEFSNMFGCTINDAMNPTGKCEVWGKA